MAYKVIITELAIQQLESYIAYTKYNLKNMQAAKSIRDDAKKTKKKLSNIAEMLPLCTNDVLASYGYRKIEFEKHNFFMVYRIDGNYIIVDAMYHDLQDFESIFTRK